jgi:hypothetical protein
VIQGSLAYANAEAIPFRVTRFIPVDLYLPEWNGEQVAELNAALIHFFRSLGLRFLRHPAIVHSSAHWRGAIQTPPLTPEELDQLELLLSTTFRRLDGRMPEEEREDQRAKDAELKKAIAEIEKLRAETELAKAETAKASQEAAKAKAEKKYGAMEALNHLSSVILKVSVGLSLLIGTTKIESKAETGSADKIVHIQKVDKSQNMDRLGAFLKELQEREEAAKKLAGDE